MKKKQRDLPDLPNLGNNNMENLFTVDLDENDQYYYDLTDTIYINTDGMNPTYFVNHTVKASDTLFGLAKRFYGTHNLWWVIAAANDLDDPFEFDNMIGGTVKILKKPMLGQILTLLAEDE